MHRSFRAVIAWSVILVGCSHGPEPLVRSRVVGPVPVRRAHVETFVPLVPASALVPRCEDIRNAPTAMGSRIVSLVFGDPAEQRIAVTLDVNGEATNYSDMRGDLNASDGHEGDMTVVAINLLRGQAIAENRPDGGDPDTVILPLAEAMTAESLGDPGAMIERVIETCEK